jgi:erythronate-4-phosphate dehydrogenase
MKVVADSGILGLDRLHGAVSELISLPGRDIDNACLLDADALLVRSITRVDKSLLDGTAVKFVGTATSGRNHIDEQYLRDEGIAFADSKGANASAVVDYVFAALAYLTRFHTDGGASFVGTTVGIVGVGCVGSLLNKRLEAAGINTLCCDPPRALSEHSEETRRFVALDDVMRCDVVCVHVPLNNAAECSTSHLIGARELALLPAGGVLINACRGGVVDEDAVRAYASAHKTFNYCSDVWRDEPIVAPEIVAAARLATPHIAGYSVQAKRAATNRLLAALQEHFFQSNIVDQEGKSNARVESPAPVMEAQSRMRYEFDAAVSGWEIIADIFDLRLIDSAFRKSTATGLSSSSFDSLRKALLQRQELGCCSVSLAHDVSDSDRQLLAAVGIEIN